MGWGVSIGQAKAARAATGRGALGFVLATALAGPCVARTEAQRIADLEAQLERSVEQIDRLSRRLQLLEAAASAPGAPSAPHPPNPASAAAAPPSAAEASTRAALPAASAAAAPQAPAAGVSGLVLHGFADIGFVASSRSRPAGAQVGSFDLYMTPQFGERAKGLVELVFEVDGDGKLAVDLERLQIGYAFSDALTLWGGRFHTPFGTWNTSFHHGQQIQTAATRPRFLDFEDAGGVLPVHTVGAWGTGAVKLPFGRVSYDLYVGNAPTIVLEDPARPDSGVLDIGSGGVRSHAASFGANIGLAFRDELDGLTLGLHGLRSTVDDTLAQPHRSRLVMVGGSIRYVTDDWEILAELYRFRNVELGAANTARSSRAYYIQLGRSFGDWTPYARVERAGLNQADPYFAQQASGASYKRDVLGLRYDLTATMALKLEGQRTSFQDRGLGRSSELRSQLAVRF